MLSEVIVQKITALWKSVSDLIRYDNPVLPIIFDKNGDPQFISEENPVPVINIIGLDNGAATAETQIKQLNEQQQLRIIEETIREELSRISFLSSVRGTSADLRVTCIGGSIVISSGTITTVGTVTAVTGIANLGGQPANQLIPANQNLLAVIGNINNVVVS